MKKILLINEGASDNLGDQLINYTIQQILRGQTENIDMDWESYSRTPEIKKIRKSTSNNNNKIKRLMAKTIFARQYFRERWWRQKKNSFSLLAGKNYDLIIIGGGQLLNNGWLFPYLFYKWVSLFQNEKIYTLGIGLGSRFNILDRYLVRKGLSRCQKISVRDSFSESYIQKRLHLPCIFIPDPVFKISDFILLGEKLERAIVLPASYEDVYLSHNGKISENDYLQVWINKINDYYSLYNEVVVSITDLIQDMKLFNDLKAVFKNDYKVKFIIPEDFNNLVELIGTSKLVFSGRMHALIIGYSYKCECEPFFLSQKLKTFDKDILENKGVTIDTLKEAVDKGIKDLVKK